MNQSADLSSLLPALCAARAAMPAIIKNCTAQVRSPKGDYTFDYADLGAILEAVVPPLSAQGLLLTFGLTEPSDGRLEVSARLWHCASGQYLDNALSAPKPESLSATGSLITYLKRYTSTALLGVSAEADDDASADEGHSITLAPTAPQAKAATNGHVPAPDAALAHPTLAHLEALKQLVTVQCGADPDELDGRIRHTLGLRADASTTQRLMVRVMTMEQYMTIFAHFTKVAEQLAKSKKEVSSHGTTSQDAPAPESTPATAAEAVPQDPSPAGSSSAPASDPEADAVERDRVRLRAEVASWDLRVSQEETEHVILHNPYSKARALLWKCRRQDTAA